MKKDNSYLKDLFYEGENINKEQESLNARKKKLQEEKKDYIKSYFKDYGIDLEVVHYIPTSHNTFISWPDFYLKKSENGNIFWIASGKRITIKDGQSVHGTVTDELWQGMWEALPEGIRNLTIEQAKENSKPVFKMSPSIFRGVDFSAPAYILHEDPNGWQLVWRKAGSAYLGRFSGSASANSGLQIIYGGKERDSNKIWELIKERYEKVTGRNNTFSTTYTNLTEGGRLSVGLIEKETNKIDLIFGDGTAQSIIEKMKLQSANKSQKRKDLKGEKDEEETPKPKKLKL